jgi:hypothetical protein
MDVSHMRSVGDVLETVGCRLAKQVAGDLLGSAGDGVGDVMGELDRADPDRLREDRRQLGVMTGDGEAGLHRGDERLEPAHRPGHLPGADHVGDGVQPSKLRAAPAGSASWMATV